MEYIITGFLPVAEGCCQSDTALGPFEKAWYKHESVVQASTLVCCPGVTLHCSADGDICPPGKPRLFLWSPCTTPVCQF